ncbi:hypothetical protein AB0B85_11175 [Micromonospora sp. NPDC049044]|uniref:hypothetical protein n=1 Tax=unclassified Micromonospora TaxID=2617518 RepID=UPI0033DA27DB
MHTGDDRIPLVDPTAARRGVRRSVTISAFLLLGLTGFTASGTAMVRTGEIRGLPFAIGGALTQLSIVVLVGSILYSRAGSDGTFISQARRTRTNRILKAHSWLLLVALVALGSFALVRLLLGDPWTLVTSAIVGAFLTLFYLGIVRILAASQRSNDQVVVVPPASRGPQFTADEH